MSTSFDPLYFHLLYTTIYYMLLSSILYIPNSLIFIAQPSSHKLVLSSPSERTPPDAGASGVRHQTPTHWYERRYITPPTPLQLSVNRRSMSSSAWVAGRCKGQPQPAALHDVPAQRPEQTVAGRHSQLVGRYGQTHFAVFLLGLLPTRTLVCLLGAANNYSMTGQARPIIECIEIGV